MMFVRCVVTSLQLYVVKANVALITVLIVNLLHFLQIKLLTEPYFNQVYATIIFYGAIVNILSNGVDMEVNVVIRYECVILKHNNHTGNNNQIVCDRCNSISCEQLFTCCRYIDSSNWLWYLSSGASCLSWCCIAEQYSMELMFVQFDLNISRLLFDLPLTCMYPLFIHQQLYQLSVQLFFSIIDGRIFFNRYK